MPLSNLSPLRRTPRVVFVTANNTLPYDRRVWQEARFVRDLGANVIGVSPAGLGPEQPREPFAVVDGIPIHRFKMQEAEAGLAAYAREFAGAFAGTARTLRWLTRRVPVDVVHAANPPDVLLPAAATLKPRGTRLVLDHHDPSPEMYVAHTGRRDLPYGALRLLERASFAAADVVIATNESLRRVAIERGRKRPDDVFVVRNGPDLTRVRRTAPDPGLKRGKPYLLGYAGVMGRADGVDHAVRALAELKQRRSDWHAVMVGDGPVRWEAQRLAEDLRIGDCVEFLGMARPSRGHARAVDRGRMPRAHPPDGGQPALHDDQSDGVHGLGAAHRLVQPTRVALLGGRRGTLRSASGRASLRDGDRRAPRRSRSARRDGTLRPRARRAGAVLAALRGAGAASRPRG